MLKNIEGRDLANSLSLSAFLRGSTRWEEQHTPTAPHPKSSRCQQLRDTLASAAWSHPRGTLRGAELHLGSCRARNPSQGPPAAHAALKSVPLAAAKTIREAASPRSNPGCVITLAASRRERSPGERDESLPAGSRRWICSAKEQRSLPAGDTARPVGCRALLAACTDTSPAQRFFPLAQPRLPHGARALLIFYHRIPLCPQTVLQATGIRRNVSPN